MQILGGTARAAVRFVGERARTRSSARRRGCARSREYAVGVGPSKGHIVPRDAAGSSRRPTSFVDDAHDAGLLVHPFTFRRENAFLPLELRSSADPPASATSRRSCAVHRARRRRRVHRQPRRAVALRRHDPLNCAGCGPSGRRGAQPRAARAPAAARAGPAAAAARARAGRRDPGAVRAVDVHRAVVAARGLRARRADRRARAARGRAGDADAQHDPPRLAARLLAVRAGDPRGAAGAAGCGLGPSRDARGDGRRRAHAARRLARRRRADAQAEIEALLGKAARRRVGLWIDLVRVPPSGTWERRRADRLRAAEDWLGAARRAERRGRRRAARAPLPTRGFGPASRKDVASFTGLAAAALDRPARGVELRRFRSEDGEELLDLPAPRSRIRRRPRRRASCRPGTRRCSSTRGAPACCRRSTGRSSSARRPALVPDVPRRRRGRRHVAPRATAGSARAVRPAGRRATRRRWPRRRSGSPRSTPDPKAGR